MNRAEVQTLVLRPPPGDAVAHLILGIPEEQGGRAAAVLRDFKFSFGVESVSEPWTSIGFSFAGLEALGVPEGYLRLFRRLAPSFTQGAVRRSVNLGDGGASAPLKWELGFGQERAHVVVSWHGRKADVLASAARLEDAWKRAFDWKEAVTDGLPRVWPLEGKRLGHPPGETGEWVHFGYRDGVSEVCIDPQHPGALDPRVHAPGALVLGDINDAGFNTFALAPAPEKVRAFFRDSSFGILRKIEQDLKSFEEQLDVWVDQIGGAIEPPKPRDFVRAKLCGRWPDGRPLRPGDLEPSGDSFALDLTKDNAGEGCPFGSHVRRMRSPPDGDGNVYERPLQRRSVPFGDAAWSPDEIDNAQRGLLGHFFCACIEDQFEHLVSQWANRPPLGFAAADRALDPLVGPHQDGDAALCVPLQGRTTQWLHGFRAWTTVKGTMYAWHPGKSGLEALLDDDFVPEEKERPWL